MIKEEKKKPKTELAKIEPSVENSNNSTKAPNSELSLSAEQQTNNQQPSCTVEDERTTLQKLSEK